MKVFYNGNPKQVKKLAKKSLISSNCGNRKFSNIPWLFKNSTEHTFCGTTKIKKPYYNNLYFIEPMEMPDKTLFNKIPVHVIDAIRQQKLKLIIFFPFEGFDLYCHFWFEKLHILFVKYKLQNAKIFLIFGNLRIRDMYKEFLKKHYFDVKFLKIYGVDWFQTNYKEEYIESYKDKFTNFDIEKNKIFLNYNGAIRSHRFSLVSELKRRNLESFGYVSFTGRYYDGDLSHVYSACERVFNNSGTKEQLDHIIDYIDNWKPQYIDIKNLSSANDRKFNIEHYNSTYFSLISETLVDNTMFLTEKTYKAIAIGHPFIIYGCKGILKYLQDQGYKTFPELFDESYDDEDDELLRLNKILDNIQTFCHKSKEEQDYLYKKVIPKIQYNRNHFLNKDTKIIYNSIFEEIINL